MTISNTATRVTHVGNGTTGPYAIANGAQGIYFASNDELLITKTVIATGVETALVLDTDYTVEGAGSDTGSVTLTTALGNATEKLSIERRTELTQEADYTVGGSFNPVSVEDALDKLTRGQQEDRERLARVPELYKDDTDGSGGFNARGNQLRNLADGTAAADAVTLSQLQDVSLGDGALSAPALDYAFDSATSGDPGSGAIGFSHATLSSATSLRISDTTRLGIDASTSIAAWDDGGTTTDRGRLILLDASTGTKRAEFKITGTVTDNSTYQTYSCTHLQSSAASPFSDGDRLAILFVPTGPQGASGGGSGDLVSTNNLSDVDDAVASFDNIAPTTTRGDIITHGASDNERLAIGAANTVLKSDGTDPGWATVSAILDSISSTQGTVLYRGATAWAALAVGTAGQVLQTQGADANPAWADTLSLTALFTSNEQTLNSNTVVSVAHSLGAVPALVTLSLRCKTTEFGWAVDDEFVVNTHMINIGSSVLAGVSLFANATNVGFILDGTTIYTSSRSSPGTTVTLTLANWKAVLRAFA